MVLYKDSANKDADLSENIKDVISLLYLLFEAIGYDFVITSTDDGNHSTRSKHYPHNNASGKCEAIDIRTRHIPTDLKRPLHIIVASMIGADYDAVLHSTHLHIEFDPK
jgi:hypothetical protein